MKKVLILIIIVLLGVMCYNVVMDGIEIGSFSILGIGKIQEENNNLTSTISKANELNDTEYPAKFSQINSAAKELKSTKTQYEELVKYSSEQEILDASKGERYDIEVLWTRIGNHATENGVVPKLEIMSSSNNTPNANDLKFTATGDYIGITDFIREIEEDAKLGFTIEEFELVPSVAGEGSVLQATFRVKDIFLNTETITTTDTSSYEENSETSLENTENTVTDEKTNTNANVVNKTTNTIDNK